MALPAPKEKYEKLRMALVEAREMAGLTQDEVARRLERPQSFVWKVENGVRRLDVIEFLELARAIGFDSTAFLQKLDKLDK